MRTKTYIHQLHHDRFAVSGFLADLRNDPKWRHEIVAAELQSGVSGTSGAEYLETVLTEGVRAQVRLTTPEVEPGIRLVVVASESGYESHYEYQFVPADGGTELTVFMSIRTSGSIRLIEPLIWSRITAWVERDLEGLDAVLSTGEEPQHVSAAEAGPDEDIYDSSGETSRAFLGEVLDNLSEAVLLFSLEGRIFYANRAVEEKLGIPHAAVLGRRFDDPELTAQSLDGEPIPPQETAVARVLGTGESVFGFEYQIEGPDGQPLIVAGSAVPLLVDGRMAGTSVTMTDITERVSAERELRASERALEEKDRAIRQAYVDVVGAVTGGRLVLMTPDELKGVLGELVAEGCELRPEGLSQARHEVIDVMSRLHVAAEPSVAVVGFGEAATNAIKHGASAAYRLCKANGALQVVVADAGPGIDFRQLPKATLLPGYSSTQTLGMGFSIMLDVADRVLLATQPGYTEVVLEFATK